MTQQEWLVSGEEARWECGTRWAVGVAGFLLGVAKYWAPAGEYAGGVVYRRWCVVGAGFK
jgi:hypothetical protein